jgi:hypothetical protein
MLLRGKREREKGKTQNRGEEMVECPHVESLLSRLSWRRSRGGKPASDGYLRRETKPARTTWLNRTVRCPIELNIQTVLAFFSSYSLLS